MAEKITGAEALLQGLVAEGVERIFGYPGGYIIPVFDRLYDNTWNTQMMTAPRGMA